MVSAVIVAAGKGFRMKADVRKQYLLLAGRSILGHTLLVFDACDQIDEIILVIPEADFNFCRKSIISALDLKTKIRLVAGGARRQDSVYNGLKALNHETDIVVIHDGVRPFVQLEKLAECIRSAKETGACIMAIPASDTLKRVGGSGIIEQTLERSGIWLAQTPQVFQYDLIVKAHETARKDRFNGTDDAQLVERLGMDVKMITGSKDNIKITTCEDLTVAMAILSKS